MKRIFILLSMLIAGSMALTACSASTESSGSEEEKAAATTIPPLGEITEDVSHVANTGRPQFLNAYASW